MALDVKRSLELTGQFKFWTEMIAVDALASVLEALFLREPLLPGVIIMRGEACLGVLSSKKFFSIISKPFGREIFLKRPLHMLLANVNLDTLTIQEETPLALACRQALTRDAPSRFEPILLLSETGPCIIECAAILSAQAEVLERTLLEKDALKEETLLASLASAEVTAIVQTAISGMITFDAAGVIDVFNPAAEKLFGWRKAEIAGQNISMLLDMPVALQQDHALADFPTAMIRSIIGKEQEIVALRKDGSNFPARLSLGYSELSATKHFFVGSIVDISEQKQTERILLRAKEDAEAGSRAKAAFIANMSHEIRTPMNAIIGFAEIMQQDSQLPRQATQHVGIILGSAKALLNILNDILNISKLESGNVTLEMVGFHLPNALRDTLRMMEREITAKNLNINLDYHAALPMRCLGDPTRLRQVVLNLVGNAVKFTERGGITLAVNPWHVADMLHFAITDTGIGMSPAQVAKVFEPFSQADVSTTRRFGGTGLGTTISKEIVELMGGEIWIESALGHGTVFHFTAHLPAAPASLNCLYEDAEIIADDYFPPRLFDVLLVEDITVNATLAKLRLRRMGHRVDWCKNGQEAVGAYQAGDYDLILMDVMMPVMNGLEATKAIRKLEKPGARIPIIALTASVMREDYDVFLMAGMDQVQAKPMDFNALLAAMEGAVPAGRGKANTIISGLIAPAEGGDFSTLDGIADHRAALAIWRDPAVFAKALAEFALDHAGDAVALENFLQDGLSESMGNAPALALVHALRGAAGNLGVMNVSERAGAIETWLKAGQCQEARAELVQLRELLNAAIKAIQGLASVPDAPGGMTVFEPAVAVELLADFSAALEKRNPYGAEPILERLAGHFSKTDLAPLQKQLNAFDFKGAQVKAAALAKTLARQEY